MTRARAEIPRCDDSTAAGKPCRRQGPWTAEVLTTKGKCYQHAVAASKRRPYWGKLLNRRDGRLVAVDQIQPAKRGRPFRIPTTYDEVLAALPKCRTLDEFEAVRHVAIMTNPTMLGLTDPTSTLRLELRAVRDALEAKLTPAERQARELDRVTPWEGWKGEWSKH